MAKPNPANGFFNMGDHTHSVPMSLFAKNRRRLLEALKDTQSPLVSRPGTLVLLQGGGDQGICEGDSSDVGPNFKQEGYFHWAFGVLEPDFYGALDLATGKSVLFMPRLPEVYAVVMGKIYSCEEFRESYRVDEVRYVDEMKDALREMGGADATLLLLRGVNTDSGKMTRTAAFDGMSEFKTDDELLHPVITECRVIKTEEEIEVMRYVTKISSDAHRKVMRTIRAGTREYTCESTFLNHVYYYGGCRHVCYTCIGGAGESGAVLHYGHAGAPNDRPVRDGDMVLFDFGGEYYRYCSDITCSYPVNGKFTEAQKEVYNAVLAANRAVVAAALPGRDYKEMHLLSNRAMLEKLLEAGIVKGDLDAMMAVNLAGRVFQPHGLGHFIGVDVHDVGGYLPGHPERPQGPGLKSLRTARVLKPNMAITIEPGCYFIDTLLDAAFKDPELKDFLVKEKLDTLRGTGGVRIEDDVIIREDHVEVMSDVPRTVEEVEAWMAGKGDGDIESVQALEKTLKK